MTEFRQRYPLMIVPQSAPSVTETSRVSDWGGVNVDDSVGAVAPVPYLHLLPDNAGDQPDAPGAGTEIA